MAHDVFISYSSQDKTVADAICSALEGRRIRCWIAPRDIQPGQNWGEAIIDAIAGGRAIVVVFSQHSNASNQVMREVERAVSKGCVIIPFRIENVVPCKAMEYFLSTPHWLDALTPPLEQHIRRLATIVEAVMRQRDVNPPNLQEGNAAESAAQPAEGGPTGEVEEIPPNEWFRSKRKGIASWFSSLFEDR